MVKYIVQKEDIGKGGLTPLITTCKCCGVISTTRPFEPLGRVQACDVGKMLKLVNGIWYAENNEQFKKRTQP